MSKARGARLPYREGDFFAVPLRSGGYGVGLVARSGPKGKVLFGYFFGPQRDKLPTLDEVLKYAPEEAVLLARFGDLSLYKKEWPLIGHSEAWDRSTWPMPDTGRVDTVTGRVGFRTTYSDTDPNDVIREVRCSPEEASALPQDALFGAGAVEIALTKLLTQRR